MNHNIFLIGFMGSGKSHWGRIWAQQEGYIFFDLDTEIEKVFELSVEQIFEKHGEEKFREMERYHLRKFETPRKNMVACGGGTPCFFDNLEWMQQHGTVIYLKALPESILERVMDETEKRPLLKKVNTSELLFFIRQKLKEREPVYLKADHVLEVDQLHKNSLDFLKKEEENHFEKKLESDSKKIIGGATIKK
ncbi:MAG: shikimate kinase [Ginsengibacter sp.]